MPLFNVVHKCFATDHLTYTTDLIEAADKHEALEIYNDMAVNKAEYPYMWDQVTLRDVHDVTPYTRKDILLKKSRVLRTKVPRRPGGAH